MLCLSGFYTVSMQDSVSHTLVTNQCVFPGQASMPSEILYDAYSYHVYQYLRGASLRYSFITLIEITRFSNHCLTLVQLILALVIDSGLIFPALFCQHNYSPVLDHICDFVRHVSNSFTPQFLSLHSFLKYFLLILRGNKL